jgi:hypothetical protein
VKQERKFQWRTLDAVCDAPRRRVLTALGLAPLFSVSRSSHAESLDALQGSFGMDEDGRIVEIIRIERRGHAFMLFQKRAGQWLAPVALAPVTRRQMETIMGQPIDIAFEGLGDGELAVLRVPQGWRIGSFVCRTGYLLATRLGPVELHRL